MYSSIDSVVHFRDAMFREREHSPAWYYYMKCRSLHVRKWRESFTLKSVK